MADLKGQVAVVAGASRGAGKGIALALGDAGATVYVAGRTTAAGPPRTDGAPGTIEQTAEEVSRRGGRGVPVRTDCTVEAEVAALFQRVEAEQGRVDVLANAVWGMGDAFPSLEAWMALWGKPFWEQPPAAWQHMMGAGPYAYFLTSTYAARLMAGHRRGLIASVTDGYVESAPGVLADGMGQGQLGYDKSESTEYVGRAVAALAADLAAEYGFTDVDGRQLPRFNPFGEMARRALKGATSRRARVRRRTLHKFVVKTPRWGVYSGRDECILVFTCDATATGVPVALQEDA